MPTVKLKIPIYLPSWIYHPLHRIKQTITYNRNKILTINLLGDRYIEWSFVAAHIPDGPGKALDFGSGASYMGLIAVWKGYHVIALDMETQNFLWQHPQFEFVRGDLLKLDLKPEQFDLVINCSTVEHVGLVGRYGIKERKTDGDIEAMSYLRKLMKPGGTMLLTIPVGLDTIFEPLHRVYGKERLPRLIEGYIINNESFWIKNQENRWIPTDKQTALNFKALSHGPDAHQNLYAIGCFVLKKP